MLCFEYDLRNRVSRSSVLLSRPKAASLAGPHPHHRHRFRHGSPHRLTSLKWSEEKIKGLTRKMLILVGADQGGHKGAAGCHLRVHDCGDDERWACRSRWPEPGQKLARAHFEGEILPAFRVARRSTSISRAAAFLEGRLDRR